MRQELTKNAKNIILAKNANALACRRKKWPFHLTQIAIIKIVGIQIVNVILVNALKKNLAGILNVIVV